jgi:putative restriction endonuclease
MRPCSNRNRAGRVGVISSPLSHDNCQFWQSAVASYNNACCICGLDIVPLLVASHIMPWSIGVAQRADPQNGLCLCNLHDKAFDRGLIAIGPNLEIVVSSKIKSSKSDFVGLSMTAFEGSILVLPRRLPPNYDYLAWHSRHVFTS